MPDDEPTLVLDLEGGGSVLRVTARRRPVAASGERWYDVTVAAAAPPFAGTVDAILTDADLRAFGADVADLGAGPGDAVLGGGRAVELRLAVDAQIGGAVGSLAVEANLTPSGDDPFPMLRWLIFDQAPFAAAVAAAVEQLLGG